MECARLDGDLARSIQFSNNCYISYSTAMDGAYFWCGGVGIGNKGRMVTSPLTIS